MEQYFSLRALARQRSQQSVHSSQIFRERFSVKALCGRLRTGPGWRQPFQLHGQAMTFRLRSKLALGGCFRDKDVATLGNSLGLAPIGPTDHGSLVPAPV
jgi:hypothetical protein